MTRTLRSRAIDGDFLIDVVNHEHLGAYLDERVDRLVNGVRTLVEGPGLPSVSCAANWGDLETRLNGPVRERQETPDHVDDRASMWTVLVSKRAATEGG